MASNLLIVQLPYSDLRTEFDALTHIEDTLIQAFSQNNLAIVDGHEFSLAQRKFNIYLYPRGAWGPVIERVHAFLKLRGALDHALIVKRLKSSGRHVVVWPENYCGEFLL